jgi:hypothetical protein
MSGDKQDGWSRLLLAVPFLLPFIPWAFTLAAVVGSGRDSQKSGAILLISVIPGGIAVYLLVPGWRRFSLWARGGGDGTGHSDGGDGSTAGGDRARDGGADSGFRAWFSLFMLASLAGLFVSWEAEIEFPFAAHRYWLPLALLCGGISPLRGEAPPHIRYIVPSMVILLWVGLEFLWGLAGTF